MLNVQELRQMYRTLGPKGTCQRITEIPSAVGCWRDRPPEAFRLLDSRIGRGIGGERSRVVEMMNPSNAGSSVVEASMNAVDSLRSAISLVNC